MKKCRQNKTVQEHQHQNHLFFWLGKCIQWMNIREIYSGSHYLIY